MEWVGACFLKTGCGDKKILRGVLTLAHLTDAAYDFTRALRGAAEWGVKLGKSAHTATSCRRNRSGWEPGGPTLLLALPVDTNFSLEHIHKYDI